MYLALPAVVVDVLYPDWTTEVSLVRGASFRACPALATWNQHCQRSARFGKTRTLRAFAAPDSLALLRSTRHAQLKCSFNQQSEVDMRSADR